MSSTLDWKPQSDPRQETYDQRIWEFALKWHREIYFNLPDIQREADVPMLTKFGEALLAEQRAKEKERSA